MKILCCNGRVHPAVCMWSMDVHKCNGEGNWWYLYQNAKKIPQCTLEWKNAKREPLGSLSKLSDKIGAIRLRWAGHCQRHSELVAHRLILGEPTHGQLSRGRPRTTNVDQLRRDTGTTTTVELAAMMDNRVIWRKQCIFDCGRASK